MSPIPLCILVVDQEARARHSLRSQLSAEGYRVIDAGSGKAAMQAVETEPDLIIVNLDLPDMPGLEIVRRLRHDGPSLPIFAVSSDDDEARKVEAFDLGVDDHLTTPLAMAEFLARVRRTLRRKLKVAEQNGVVELNGLRVDLQARDVRVDGRTIRLTPKEFELLNLLVCNAGRVLTRSFILSRLWGPSTGSQHLRFYVSQLRSKIEPAPKSPKYIKTVPGIGYQLSEPQ